MSNIELAAAAFLCGSAFTSVIIILSVHFTLRVRHGRSPLALPEKKADPTPEKPPTTLL